MNIWQSQIPHLSTSGLIQLARNAESRIGSHVAGGNPVDDYVERHKYLLTLVQEELEKR